MPAKKSDAATDAAEREHKNGEHEHPSDPAAPTRKMSARWELVFEAEQARRYHMLRANWYQALLTASSVAAVLSGTTAFASILKDGPTWLAGLATIIVTTAGVLPAACNWAGALAQHTRAYQSFGKALRHAETQEPEGFPAIRKKLDKYDTIAPSNRRVVSILAHHQACCRHNARVENHPVHQLTRWQRLTAHIFEHPSL